ncbi:MAG: flagellin [Natronohydrobacter sp.]|nr:flagellin [Natronohydrobacter sp.]
MSSILTNSSAMVALQTLRGINKNLAQTQSEISTGKSVATARDNAAVWAISKTMESDVKGFKAISDTLSLGSATVGVARAAAESVTDLLTQMKGLIVNAQEENVDRSKIQTDINALRDQIATAVGSAQFNGLNLVNDSGSINVLASLDRAGSTVSASYITVNRQDLGSQNNELLGAFGTDTVAESVADGDPFALTIDAAAGEVGAKIILNIGDRQVSYTVTEADVNGGGTAEENIAAGLRNAILNSGLPIDIGALDANGDPIGGLQVELSGADLTLTNNTGVELTMTARAVGEGTGGLAGLATIDVTTDPQGALAEIETLITTATEAAAAFGSAQKRIDTQNEFVKNLTDSLTTGIGALVDADMEATSARLQALQVQQQLATQSLSIANQQPQNILALFR